MWVKNSLFVGKWCFWNAPFLLLLSHFSTEPLIPRNFSSDISRIQSSRCPRNLHHFGQWRVAQMRFAQLCLRFGQHFWLGWQPGKWVLHVRQQRWKIRWKSRLEASSTRKSLHPLFNSPHFFLVVTQSYDCYVNQAHVIKGNDALMKCDIPSFVTDFVSLLNWQDNEDNIFSASRDG